MARYAIEIKNQNLDLITLLNHGVTPLVEGNTFFVFDATLDSEVPNKIVTEEELISSEEFATSIIVYNLK